MPYFFDILAHSTHDNMISSVFRVLALKYACEHHDEFSEMVLSEERAVFTREFVFEVVDNVTKDLGAMGHIWRDTFLTQWALRYNRIMMYDFLKNMNVNASTIATYCALNVRDIDDIFDTAGSNLHQSAQANLMAHNPNLSIEAVKYLRSLGLRQFHWIHRRHDLRDIDESHLSCTMPPRKITLHELDTYFPRELRVICDWVETPGGISDIISRRNEFKWAPISVVQLKGYTVNELLIMIPQFVRDHSMDSQYTGAVHMNCNDAIERVIEVAGCSFLMLFNEYFHRLYGGPRAFLDMLTRVLPRDVIIDSLRNRRRDVKNIYLSAEVILALVEFATEYGHIDDVAIIYSYLKPTVPNISAGSITLRTLADDYDWEIAYKRRCRDAPMPMPEPVSLD